MSVIDWDEVDNGLVGAKAIAFDTCHKIYVLMDDEQVAETRGYGYGDEPDSFYTCDEMSHSEMLEKLKEWFGKSCALKFIQAVETNHTDPNAGYTSLIEQGATEYELCYICGAEGCEGECEDEDEDDYEDEEDEE